MGIAKRPGADVSVAIPRRAEAVSSFDRHPIGTCLDTAAELTGYRKMFVLDGEVVCADGRALKTSYYAFIPPGQAHGFGSSAPAP